MLVTRPLLEICTLESSMSLPPQLAYSPLRWFIECAGLQTGPVESNVALLSLSFSPASQPLHYRP